MLLKKSPSIRDGRRHSLEWSIGGEVPLMPVQLRHGDKLCVRSEPSRELVGCRLTIEPALEEDWHDAVSRAEAAHAFSNRFNHVCTVRYRDEGQAQFGL